MRERERERNTCLNEDQLSMEDVVKIGCDDNRSGSVDTRPLGNQSKIRLERKKQKERKI